MAFLAVKKREMQAPPEPAHIARRTIRKGLDIVVDVEKRKTFLDGLGGQHELEQITYDGTFIACKLPGKFFFTQTASINISLWKASIPPLHYGTPEDLVRKLDSLLSELKKESAFQTLVRKREITNIRASILGENMEDFPVTYQKYLELLQREHSTARQSLLWLIDAAKALQEKRYA